MNGICLLLWCSRYTTSGLNLVIIQRVFKNFRMELRLVIDILALRSVFELFYVV